MFVTVEFVAVGCVRAVPSKLLLCAGFLDFFSLRLFVSLSSLPIDLPKFNSSLKS